MTTSKLRARSFSASASSSASEAGAVKSTAVMAISNLSPYNNCTDNYRREERCDSGYSNYRERGEDQGGGKTGAGPGLDQPAAGQPCPRGLARAPPSRQRRPLTGRVRGPVPPPSGGGPPSPDERDRHPADQQPQRHNSDRRPSRERRLHHPRHAPRQPARRARHAHRARPPRPRSAARGAPQPPRASWSRPRSESPPPRSTVPARARSSSSRVKRERG